jgi:hypothetical protein
MVQIPWQTLLSLAGSQEVSPDTLVIFHQPLMLDI